MLQYAPVSHQYPFTPSWTLKNAPAKGVTYCQNLHAYNVDSSGTYSRALTDLIYECLYEIPYFRPSSRELKVRIAQAFQALLATNPAVEPWSDFIPPAPGSNVVTPTAQPTTTGPAPLVPIVQPDMTDGAGKCTYIRPNGKRCKLFKTRIHVNRQRCHMHQDNHRYP
jgi:hypothetical protein